MKKEARSGRIRVALLGTASVHLVNYAALVADDVELHVISSDKLEVPTASSVQTSSLSLRPFYAVPSRISELRKRIAEIKPDVIHVHQANTCAWYALRAAGRVPVLVTAWGSDVLVRSNSLVGRLLLGYILRNGAAFTASCQYIVDRMHQIDAMRGKQIEVANFGIEDDFPNVPKEPIIYSNRYLNPLYRIDWIIRDFALFVCSTKAHEWKLVIAGSGSEEIRLKDLVHSLGLKDRVVFTGWLKPAENRHWYARATVYVALPESDSTSISLYEAMAAGCVPVVTDLPANREVIRGGDNGILVRESDSGFIARAVSMTGATWLVENRLLALKRAGKSQNRERFLRIYASLCHGH
jgi:glycosyltransferase involved in cell wall biosynthesis